MTEVFGRGGRVCEETHTSTDQRLLEEGFFEETVYTKLHDAFERSWVMKA
jgi:hypothetical protein